ncbi:MAG: shikimate kinase [Gemmataceae bacterium]
MSPSRVVLIGPRGSGKTTVARLLAGRLGVAWYDADALLEGRCGQSVRELFEREGEAGFRRRESELLRELAFRREGHVLATGGGVVLDPANRELLRSWDVVVWLTADVDTLWSRIAGDANRPALLGGGRDEVARVVALREPLYRECAHVVIDTASPTPEGVAAEVYQRVYPPSITSTAPVM